MIRNAIRRNGLNAALTLVLSILGSTGMRAQEGTTTITPPRGVLSGSASIATDYRSTNREFAGSNGAAADAAISLTSEFSWGRIPFDLSYSTRKDLYGRNYLRYGIHPELFDGAIRLHAGDFRTDSPELTFGRASLYGIGATTQLGNFRTSASYGRVERPYSWSGRADDRRTSDRMGLELGIGFGNDTGGFVDLRYSRIADDQASSGQSSFDAQENTALAARFNLPLFDNRLRIDGEASIAGWSSDIGADPIENAAPILDDIFTPRVSSQFDGAGRVGIRWSPSYTASFALNGRWIGPGYVSLAQPYMLNDLFEASFSPTLSLFEGKLYANGSLGVEWDNLAGTKEGRTTRITGTAYATAQTARWLTLNLSYSDYGAASDHANDTARFGYVSRSLHFSPTFYWNGLGGANTGSIAFAHQNGKVRNPGGEFSVTTVSGLDGTWNLGLPSGLSLATRIGYSTTASETYGFDAITADETVSHTLLNGKLTGSVTAGFSTYLNGEKGTTLNFGASAFYHLNDFGRISVALSNSIDQGFGRNASPTRELYGAIRYGTSF